MEHILSLTSEQDMKSTITLVTRRIEEIGKYMYFRFLRRHLIPEEMCGELYEGIVEHLRQYRDSNPEVKKVKRAFITTCTNWIAAKLRRRERREKTRESLMVEIVKNDLDALDHIVDSRPGRRYERRVLCALRDLYKSGKIRKQHVLWYVLYHGFAVRPEFSRQLLKAAGICTGSNLRSLTRVRQHMERRTGERRERELRNIDNKYKKVMQTHCEISRLSDTGFFGEATLKKGELARLNEERKKGFERLSRIKVVPSFKWLAGLLGESESTLKYGTARVERLVMERCAVRDAD